ncbi:MAG: SPOR domain-containing protein, partial [Gammaproteobacteria bacterium]
MQETDKEKLRAFEQRMHDEGADGFADGPRPWETWDESGAQAPGTGRHVWEGKARRIYKNSKVRRSLGDRILSGLAVLSLATMVVGITGVYLTEHEPPAVAWTAVQPTPIPLPGHRETVGTRQLPARTLRHAPVVADIESLPPTAAGDASPAHSGTIAEAPANRLPSLDDTAPVAATPAAITLADNIPEDSSAVETDIEIVAAPAALLLTSATDTSRDGSDGGAGFEVSGMDMDPALAMEIATAPAVDVDMEALPLAATDTGPATAKVDSNREIAPLPAANRINREPTTSDFAAAGGTTGDTAGLPPLAESGAADTDPVAMAATRPDREAPAETAGDPDLSATQQATPHEPAPTAYGPLSATLDAPGETAAQPAIPAGDGTPQSGDEAPADSSSVIALAEPEPVAAAPSPAAAAAAEKPAGDWVVNLATYAYEAMAKRKLAEFQKQGVNGEIERTLINDKPMYRVRVT